MDDTEKKEKIAPTDEYNELRYRELETDANDSYKKMIEAKDEFGKAYKIFHKHMKDCASTIKEMLEEVTKIKEL